MELSTLSTIVTFGSLILVGIIFWQNILIRNLENALKRSNVMAKLALSKYQLVKHLNETTTNTEGE